MGEAVGTATSKANAALTADGHSEKDSSRTGSEPSRHDQHACAFRTAAAVCHRRAEPQLGQPSLAAKCTVLGFTTVAHSAVPAKLCISARNGSGPCNLVWHQGRNSATRPCLLHGPSSISVSAGPLPVPLSGPGTSIEVQTPSRTVGLPSAPGGARPSAARCFKFKSRLASSRGARWQATPPVGPGTRTWQVATSLRPTRSDPKLCPQRGFAELGDMHGDMAPAVLTCESARKPTQARAQPRRGPRPAAHLPSLCEPRDNTWDRKSTVVAEGSKSLLGWRAASDLGVIRQI